MRGFGAKLYSRDLFFSGWSWECLFHWGQFFSLSIAGLLMVCIEWWSFEIGTILAGVYPKVEIDKI